MRTQNKLLTHWKCPEKPEKARTGEKIDGVIWYVKFRTTLDLNCKYILSDGTPKAWTGCLLELNQ